MYQSSRVSGGQQEEQTVARKVAPVSPDVTPTPGDIRVMKRNGAVVGFDATKIVVAMSKAFLAVEGNTAAASNRIHETVERLTAQVVDTFHRRMPSGGIVHIEDIQDQVELCLMRNGEHRVARDYVLYREERKRMRSDKVEPQREDHPEIKIVKGDGSKEPLDVGRLKTVIAEACDGLTDVDGALVLQETLKNLYDGVTQQDVNAALIMSARTMVEKEPNYTYVTARLLLDDIRAKALACLGVAEKATQFEMETFYPQALKKFLQLAVKSELVADELLEYDLDQMAAALIAERDNQFTYLGLQTLYDRYFIHKDEVRIELPQVFFMRIAMGLALREDNREERAIEFYQLLSSFDYMASTPTLFNSGTLRSQLSSCYLTTVPDNLDGIYGAIRDNAMLSKWAGGLGNDWTPVRALGSYIKGTNGKSQGVVPF